MVSNSRRPALAAFLNKQTQDQAAATVPPPADAASHSALDNCPPPTFYYLNCIG
jgi:hypothetical protein